MRFIRRESWECLAMEQHQHDKRVSFRKMQILSQSSILNKYKLGGKKSAFDQRWAERSENIFCCFEFKYNWNECCLACGDQSGAGGRRLLGLAAIFPLAAPPPRCSSIRQPPQRRAAAEPALANWLRGGTVWKEGKQWQMRGKEQERLQSDRPLWTMGHKNNKSNGSCREKAVGCAQFIWKYMKLTINICQTTRTHLYPLHCNYH